MSLTGPEFGRALIRLKGIKDILGIVYKIEHERRILEPLALPAWK